LGNVYAPQCTGGFNQLRKKYKKVHKTKKLFRIPKNQKIKKSKNQKYFKIPTKTANYSLAKDHAGPEPSEHCYVSHATSQSLLPPSSCFVQKIFGFLG
jgi:hypothetical protein